ncbi:MAG: hypothetical protein H6901_05755 [Rhodobacteraceae bacterium]|nr:hypothetical protein [Paracoccaceae bacterium]MCP5341699.1 hypothetical protein [Paracoccaceae bacterium]
MRTVKSIVLAVAAAALGAGAAAQPKNQIGEPLAQIFIQNGCEMAEQDAFDALIAGGWFLSDFQAQALALGNDGFLVGTPDGRLKLVNWGPCT